MRTAADTIDLGMGRAAVANFYPRLRLRFAAEGRQSAHLSQWQNAPCLEFDLVAASDAVDVSGGEGQRGDAKDKSEQYEDNNNYEKDGETGENEGKAENGQGEDNTVAP